jgi:uncharacterized membrane protein YoaK (UPF0700 family)
MPSAPSQAAQTRGNDADHGPLPIMLLALTGVTGLVDAISYLKLGHVFVANITGNIAFLGFAVADTKEFSIGASLTATAAFLVGALGGGRLAVGTGSHRGRLLAIGILVEVVVVGIALIVSIVTSDLAGEFTQYELIVLLAVAMGLQTAVARKLGVPDLTTTVLTLTLAGLAADSSLAGGWNPRARRRLLATGTVLLGAAAGARLIFQFGICAVLAIAFVLLAASGVAAYREINSTDKWTVGT